MPEYFNNFNLEIFRKPNQSFRNVDYDPNAELNWDAHDWLSQRAENDRGPKYTEQDVKIFNSHVPEYKQIEQNSKSSGTWLQMPDGSRWVGDPREWVMMQSEAFKKNYQENPWYTGQAEWATKVTLPDGTVVDTDKVKRARYHNGEMWFSNDAGYAQYFADTVGREGLGVRGQFINNPNYKTDHNIKGTVFLAGIPKTGNYRKLEGPKTGYDHWRHMPFILTETGFERTNEKTNLLTDDLVSHSRKLGDDGLFLFNVNDGPVLRNKYKENKMLPYFARPGHMNNDPNSRLEMVPINEFISQPGFTEKIKFIRGNNGNFDPNTDDKYSAIFKTDSPLFVKKGGRIHIKKKNRGKFTEYCGGKVTEECIDRGKKSKDPKIRKRATFAANARKWKHENGGILKAQEGTNELYPAGIAVPSNETVNFFKDFAQRYKKLNHIDKNQLIQDLISKDKAIISNGGLPKYSAKQIFIPSNDKEVSTYSHELVHKLNDLVLERTDKERKLLNDAYPLSIAKHVYGRAPEDVRNELIEDEKFSTNTELRRKISSDYGNVLGKKLNKVIKSLSTNDIIDYVNNINGYVGESDFLKYPEHIIDGKTLFEHWKEDIGDVPEYYNMPWEELPKSKQDQWQYLYDSREGVAPNYMIFDEDKPKAIKKALIKVAQESKSNDIRSKNFINVSRQGGILKAQGGTTEGFWSKLWNAVKEGGMAARDAKLGAVGAQQVRDLYSEGKNQEAQDLAKQYAKANTTGIALAGGAASTGLLGDLMVTGATTAADTFIDGDVDNFGKNLSVNAAFDLVGHGAGKLLRKVDWQKVKDVLPNSKADVSEYINTIDDALPERQPLTMQKSPQFWDGTSKSRLSVDEKMGLPKNERNQPIKSNPNAGAVTNVDTYLINRAYAPWEIRDGKFIFKMGEPINVRGLSERAPITFHFTTDTQVKPHSGGDSWANAKTTYLVPYKSVVKHNGMPANIEPMDTWWTAGSTFEFPTQDVKVLTADPKVYRQYKASGIDVEFSPEGRKLVREWKGMSDIVEQWIRNKQDQFRMRPTVDTYRQMERETGLPSNVRPKKKHLFGDYFEETNIPDYHTGPTTHSDSWSFPAMANIGLPDDPKYFMSSIARNVALDLSKYKTFTFKDLPALQKLAQTHKQFDIQLPTTHGVKNEFSWDFSGQEELVDKINRILRGEIVVPYKDGGKL